MPEQESNVDDTGLTTTEALKCLYNDIEQVLYQYESSSNRMRNTKSWIKDAIGFHSQHTVFCWTSALALILSATALLSSYFINFDDITLVSEAIILISLIILNLLLVLFDNKLRHYEIPKCVHSLLNTIKSLYNVKWEPEYYPNLCSPFSPCITLQWTYRDGKIVNLPWALLVKNDIVIIRPGQLSPGYCESLEKNAEYPLLHAKEVYGPALKNPNETFTVPKACKPLENKKYRLLETPYLNNLRIALEQALDRPITHHNQQRYLVMVKCIEMIAFPVMLFIVLVISFVRFVYLEHYLGVGSWIENFLLVPTATCLPLLPLVFPIAWIGLNCWGVARFKTLFDTSLRVPMNYDVFDDSESNGTNYPELHCTFQQVWKTFVRILFDNENTLSRSVNIVHILGSVTALCCVDKKGILSWPNPTAEKIFFLRNSDNISQSSSLANLNELNTDTDSLHGTSTGGTNHTFADHSSCSMAEVLDLTNDQSKPNKLHFDDVEWHRHINSLKPLGLSILLNTCNIDTQDNYLEFCSHVTCEAMYNENLIPVTNRRCLCELAKQIGFVDEAQKVFTLEQQLSSFRHLQPEMVRRDNKFARSLHLATKLKFPFPHMVAVIVKEQTSGALQLLSQGTADIILDSCVDYWDGHDLCPLSQGDRKKVQDFYQRTSLTAYCTAYAYRPLNRKVNSQVSKLYLELPSDSKNLYMNHRSPTPMHWDCRSVLEPKIKAAIGQYYSTDSLLYNDSPCTDISDTESCFDLQCNQVFIGMVTMQYQAQADMVQLIEQLESACIRFVHFSKENELRSRVFSEKMGLESGWNCHISLLSERTRRESGPSECWANNGTVRISSPGSLPHRSFSQRPAPNSPTQRYASNLEASRTMSFSAPSAINMEHSVVKFDTEREPLMAAPPPAPVTPIPETPENATSQDSVLVQPTDMNSTTHDWQSLSCLTDSTEQSAPVHFDMSNRAKLPRGIDKIRPHIEMIDNVPLLVSLFTDCTATVTREMLHIMQDYGEVVCVVGSSANSENTGIFMQADAGIAIEPLYPQVCQKIPPYVVPKDCQSPIDLARCLNSISCSLSLRREDQISVYHLVMESRHFMLSLWSAIQFWLCCCICLSFVQLTAAVLMLPPLLTPGQVIWECCVIVPLLSVALVGVPTDTNVMKKPLGKNHIIFNIEVAIFVLWCYGLKFLPVIFVCIVSFAGNLAVLCNEYCSMQNCTCTIYYLPNIPENATIVRGYSLLISQHIVLIVILLHFVTISMSFIHREHSIWSKSPHVNVLWLFTIIVLFLLQTFHTATTLVFSKNENDFSSRPHFIIILFIFTSPLITFMIMELTKRQEIKVNLRYQRRARLDFGTKLGMNSPF